MANQILLNRLEGVRQSLMGAYASGGGMSSATRGLEREVFVKSFLERVFPSLYRFGTGDATDVWGRRSGQLDVVIEVPFAPSLPAFGGEPRLYPAESIGAVVEVKSDLANQWPQVVNTAHALYPVQRMPAPSMVMTSSPFGPSDRIPLFAVGFTGWKTVQTASAHLDNSVPIDGILILDPPMVVIKQGHSNGLAEGPEALWAFIIGVHESIRSLIISHPDLFAYFSNQQAGSIGAILAR